VVRGQILRALAGGNDLEARRAAPVDQLADQGRLVAVRERVDDSRLPRTQRQQRPGQCVGFDGMILFTHDPTAIASRNREL